MAILNKQIPCGQFCDVAPWSLRCFLRNGYIRDPKTGKWCRDENGAILKTMNRECDGLDPRPPEEQKRIDKIYAVFVAAYDSIERRRKMAKTKYEIELDLTDEELEQMWAELGDAEPTEENITATPTFLRIWDRVYEQMKTIEEEAEHEGA